MSEQKRKPPKLAPKARANPQSRENAKPQLNKAPPSESKAGKPPQSGSANSSEEKADIPSSATTNVAKSAPKASSDSNVKKPPKLGPKKDSIASTAASSRATGTPTPKKPEERRPSLKNQPSSQRLSALRRSSTKSATQDDKSDTKPKPRKLPAKSEDQPTSTADDSSRRPSLKPRRTSVSTKGEMKGGKNEQDLKSALSEEQRKDLGELVVGITIRMRQNIEDNFDSYATLTKLSRDDATRDPLENLDFDPGSVDIGEYEKERKLRDEREKELSTPKMKELKDAALHWFDDWRVCFLKRVDEALEAKGKVFRQPVRSDDTGDITQKLPSHQKIESIGEDDDNSSLRVEDMFPRVGTSLTKLSMAERTLVLHSMLLLLLSLEHYNAASRVFLLYLTSGLKLGFKNLREDEEKVAKGLLEAAKQVSINQDALNKGKENQESRKWKIRLATVAGAAIVGVTGGYAAPVIAAGIGTVMGGLGLEATAAAGYLGSLAGNAYLVGSLFGAYGGQMTGDVMKNLSADVEDFGFLPVHGERKEHEDNIEAATDDRRLRVVISISGWLLEKEEVVTPWRVLNPSAEVFALRFELEALMKFGQSIKAMSANDTYGIAHSAFKNRAVVTDFTSNIWPMALVKLARVIENPFSIAKARADKAGKVLAEALIDRTQGERPVTLIGYSVGARVIWSCLMTLADRKAFGFVESVVLIGAPVPSETTTWRSMRAVVTGRLINVYSKNDYLLAFLHRASSLSYNIAGLRPIEGLSGIENVDVSAIVTSHLRYRYIVGSILQKARFEDTNKDEVAKGVEAFKVMVEEEKKHDYVKDAKEDAGDMYKPYLRQGKDLKKRAEKLYEQSGKLYEQYGGGGKKSGKKAPPADISDVDAEKQVSAMEKDVNKQTEKGLMQWAVEQLYIARPSVPSAEDAKDPSKLAGDTTKTANKQADAATKSLFQRAKEAAYLSRSGGPEGEDLAKVKSGDIQGAADGAAPKGYLASAAGYIPTGYIPYLGAGGEAASGADKATREAGNLVDKAPKVPEAPDTRGAAGEKPKAPKLGGDRKESIQDSRKGSAPKLEKKQSTPSATKAPEKLAPKDSPAKSSTGGGVTNYIPSFGFGGSKDKGKDATDSRSKESNSEALAKKPNDAAIANTTDAKNDGKSPKKDEETPGKLEKKTTKKEDNPQSGYGSYIPHFGFGGGSGKGRRAANEREEPEREGETRKKPDKNVKAQEGPDKVEKEDETAKGGGDSAAKKTPGGDEDSEDPEGTKDNKTQENNPPRAGEVSAQERAEAHPERTMAEGKEPKTEDRDSKEAKGDTFSKEEDDEQPQAGVGISDYEEDDGHDDDADRTPTAEKPDSGFETPAARDKYDAESRPTTRDSETSGEGGSDGKEDDPFKS